MMYATMMQCDLCALASAAACDRAARGLVAALAALPGFVAFVAIETDPAVGVVTAVYLAEERAGLAEAERAIAQWQREQVATVRSGVRLLGAGEVIAQKGL